MPELIREIDVLWISAGLSCDGDTIAMTAATQPSIEDLVLGNLPWIPKVRFHNLFLTYENGDEFLERFHTQPNGELRPSFWWWKAPFPTRPTRPRAIGRPLGPTAQTGQPITTCEWIDRLAPKAWAIIAAGTCATYGGIHAMEGNPTGLHGTRRLPGMGLEIHAGIPIVCIPGCPVQPDNFMETLLYLLTYGCRTRAHDPVGRSSAAHLAVRANGARRM